MPHLTLDAVEALLWQWTWKAIEVHTTVARKHCAAIVSTRNRGQSRFVEAHISCQASYLGAASPALVGL